MLVRADVTCFLCGHVAGLVEGECATLWRSYEFHPRTDQDKLTLRSDGQLRCARCDGNVFFEGTEPKRVRNRAEVTAADFADDSFVVRRSTPPRRSVARSFEQHDPTAHPR